jgi:hypothetical protein
MVVKGLILSFDISFSLILKFRVLRLTDCRASNDSRFTIYKFLTTLVTLIFRHFSSLLSVLISRKVY